MTHKFPKSLGACADLLAKYKAERLAADKHAADLKARENALVDHIVDHLDKESSGAIGKTHKVRIVVKQKPQIKDFEALTAWVKKTGRFDVLQRRLSEQAIMDTFAAPKSKGVPGVELFNAVTVSLTKI